jgi:putative flippase GtrA
MAYSGAAAPGMAPEWVGTGSMRHGDETGLPGRIRSAFHRVWTVRRVSGEAARYIAVQVAAYGVELATFWVFLAIDPRLIAVGNVVGKFNAGLFAFVSHRHFTFRGEKRRSLRDQLLLYGLSLAGNSLLGTALLLGLVRLGLGETTAKLAADCGLIALTFAVSRSLIFARAAVAPPGPERAPVDRTRPT